MRDTLLLRARLQAALISGPLAVAGAALACGPGPSSGPAPQVRSGHDDPGTPAAKPKPGRVAAGAAIRAEGAKDEESSEAEDVRPFAKSPYPERWGLDPYDPEAAEEEGCVNGDWCGPVDAARKFANADAGDEMGCPSRLLHVANNGTKESDKVYKGFSFDPMMQGRIRRLSTQEARDKEGRDDICCYHWFNYCSGRPLLGGAEVACTDSGEPMAALLREEAQVAPLIASAAWTGALEDLAEVAEPALRRHLAGAWLADARMEHASIAAFARATLELLAVGAPPALVAAAQQAGIDEVEHAKACFAVARRYAGEAAPERGPGPLPAVAPRALDLAGLAVATFVEGCVGETIAALTATRAARRCADPAIKATLERIAADETRHAELAWATVAWALGSGDPAVASALSEAATALGSVDVEIDEAPFAAELLAAHGRLDPHAQAATREDAWREIIGPTLASLLAA